MRRAEGCSADVRGVGYLHRRDRSEENYSLFELNCLTPSLLQSHPSPPGASGCQTDVARFICIRRWHAPVWNSSEAEEDATHL